jgi:mRNA-degrading endonuclease HigB of HigAB toxin-antitoxin module
MGTSIRFPVWEQSHNNMKVVGRENLEEYLTQKGINRAEADVWLFEATIALWKSGKDVKEQYMNANFLPNNQIIFKLKESNCEVETKISFQNEIVLIQDVKTTKN